ncbi:MAG: radical SAM protein [Deltaproteobacteria bacterium]|nr:radical SAM protein [Deltaproteobacteria bacterium]
MIQYPAKAMIELSRACNLRCPVCPVGNGSARMYPPMPFELFRHIIDQAGTFVQELLVHNFGEPLLHPQIVECIAYAKEKGIKQIKMHTNGLLLSPAIAAGLVRAGLDKLKVSLDGLDQATYEQYRRGGDFNTLIQNISRLREIRERLGMSRPIIQAQYIVMRHNEERISEFEVFAKRIGADQIKFKTFNALLSGEKGSSEGRSMIPGDFRLQRYTDGDATNIRAEYVLPHCTWPWDCLVVIADGTIVPCCYDFNGEYRLGTVSNERFRSWWATPERKAFRRRVRSAMRTIPICSRCPVGIPDLGIPEKDIADS